jgi:hypothetical protein
VPTTDHFAAGLGYDLSLLKVYPITARPAPGKLHQVLSWIILRARIFLLAAPLAGVVVAGRYGNVSLKLDSPVEGVAVPPIITITAFILGTVLANVMADYKESEKIPAELMGYFQTLVGFARAEAASYNFDAKPLLLNIETMLLCVLSTLDSKCDFADAVASFDEAWHEFQVYCSEQSHHGIRLEGPEHCVSEILKKWARIFDIGR